jgi:hypothetical protein
MTQEENQRRRADRLLEELNDVAAKLCAEQHRCAWLVEEIERLHLVEAQVIFYQLRVRELEQELEIKKESNV